MKKLYYLLLLALPLLFQSCLKDDKDLFGKSAAERLDEVLKQDQAVLTGASNGWMMQYFPEKSQKYGGYTLFVKFDDNDAVTVASELAEADQTETSMYQLIGDSGPVLTFNTHNSLFHYFSDPRNPDGIGPGDSGMGGDYEFLVLEATPEKVTMKGKKTGNTIIMTPIAEGVDWANLMQEYIETAAKFENKKFAFKMGDISSTASLSYRTFTLTYPGENDAVETQTVAYRITPEGFSFYKALEIGGKKISQMKLEIDENGTISLIDQASGASLYEVLPTVAELFAENQWYFHRDNLSPAAKEIWDTGYNKLLAKGYDLYYAYVGVEPDFGLYGFCFGALIGNRYSGTLLTYEYVLSGENEITFKYEGRTTDQGLEFFNNGVSDIVSIIGSKTFTITADNSIKPTEMTLTDKANPDISFKLTKEVINFPHYSE